jgi:hypothetical protein
VIPCSCHRRWADALSNWSAGHPISQHAEFFLARPTREPVRCSMRHRRKEADVFIFDIPGMSRRTVGFVGVLTA